MKIYIRKGGIIAGSLILLLGLLYLGIAIFISANQQLLRRKLTEKITERTHGQVEIRSITPALFKTFPFLSMEIDHLVVRDSAFKYHHKNMLLAEKVYLRISIFKLFSKNKMNRLIMEDGYINIFRDSTGYSNTYVFQNPEKKNNGSKSARENYPDIELKNILIDFQNPGKDKHHKILARKIISSIDSDNGKLTIHANTSLFIHELAFNIKKGGYLTNTKWRSNLEIHYNKESRKLQFQDQQIILNNNKYILSGEFSTKPAEPDFFINIKSSNTRFADCAALLPEAIAKKLDRYTIDGVIAVNAMVRGKTKFHYKPLVNVSINVPNAAVKTNFIKLDQCSFKGSFSNELVPGLERNDSNSIVRLEHLKGRLGKININMDSLWIFNLKSPQLKGTLHSNFNLVDLNEHSGSTTLQFTGGKAAVHIYYNGPLERTSEQSGKVYGKIDLDEGSMVYLPRNFIMKNTSGNIILEKNNLLVKSLKVNTGLSNLTMNGFAENFLSMINESPDKLLLIWNIHSNNLHLDDYKGFLSRQKTEPKKSSKDALFRTTSSKIDKMLVDGTVQLNLDADRLDYKKFDATNVNAKVLLTSTEARINEVSMNHAKGKISLKGVMKDQPGLNKVTLQANLVKIDLPTIFHAFSDFGQDALTEKNIHGQITSYIDLNTDITDQATMVRENTKGTIHFLIENFELNNFEPLQKISDKVFKKQDFTRIKFADLENTLMVDGTSFSFDRMEIRSTALTMFVKGVYDVKNGTDMGITLPVRNLLKSNANIELSDEGKTQKGISIRLRAKTGDDGKLKVGWDPLRLGGRNP